MLTVTDLFCGAGGSSTGAIQVPGVRVRIAANHWDLAVQTHNTNHPGADHATADIHQANPAYFPGTDILWASPECTKWTVASGKAAAHIDPGLWEDPLADEAAQRSRMLMFDVPRFAAHHHYRAVVVENVVDVSTRAQYAPAFDRWLHEMHLLGYSHREVYLNAMHAHAAGDPAPQSRDRLYVVFWQTGDRAPDLDQWTRPYAHCELHGAVQAIQAWKNPRKPARGRYRQQYVWRCPNAECRNQILEPGWLPAAAIIDWTLRGTRIGDRDKPLSPKTMARIQAGLQRHGTHIAEVAGHTYERRPGVRTWPVNEPLRTLHTTASKALLVPVEGRDGKEARPAADPLRTMTTRSETGILVTLRGHNAPKTTDGVLDTFAASGNHHGLIMRNNSGGAEMLTPAREDPRTLTTAGHQSLLVPYRSRSNAVPDTQPLPTVTTVDPAAHVVTAADIDDCEFRMLEPSEIKRGMAFPAEYVMLGNRREQVKMAGNAVCPPAARDLIAAVAEALT